MDRQIRLSRVQAVGSAPPVAGGLAGEYAFTGEGTCTDDQTTTCTASNNNVTLPQTAGAVILRIN